MIDPDRLPVKAGRDKNGKIQMFCSFEGCNHKADEGYCTKNDIRVSLKDPVHCKGYETSA